MKQFDQFLANQSGSGFDQGRRNAQRNLAFALSVVGDAERQLGNLPAAMAALNRRLQVAKDLGATELELAARNSLGYLAIARDDLPEAMRHLEEAKQIAIATDNSVVRDVGQQRHRARALPRGPPRRVARGLQSRR